MMKRQPSHLRNIVVLASLGGASLVACGDEGGDDENVGTTAGTEQTGNAGAGNTAGTGAAGSGTAGTDSSAGAGNTAGTGAGGTGAAGADNAGGMGGGGEANAGGTGGSAMGGTGGTGMVDLTLGDPDEVVAAACDWEFRCCDAGELNYRMSPFAPDSDTCASRLIFEMRQSNATDNPYLSGSAAAGGLLGTLGYVVDLSRVTVSADGVAACVAALEVRGCAVESDPDARCDGPGEADPCALDNLFDPVLEIGAECTVALTEGGLRNDIECVIGSTCLAASDPDNPNDVPTCVKRGRDTEPCTADDDCDFNFYCGAGSCTEKGSAGATCSFNDPAEPAPGDENIQCQAGLSCHPTLLTCMEGCTLNSICAISGDADFACPENSGCAPLEVAESTATFRTCEALGSTAADLCNSDADCVVNRYCDGTNCQSDKQDGDSCVEQNECATGLHCDLNDTGNCITNLAATTACTDDFQCGPSSAGCLDGGSDGFVCRNNLLANSSPCGENAACSSGRCEFADDVAVETTCVSGENAGQACDSIPGDGDAQSCAAGLLCFGETGATESGTCVTKAGAGLECTNPDGDPDTNMCASASACEDSWNEGEICTDAPIGKAEGGTGLVCDGS